MPAAGVVLILAVVIVVLALVYYLVATIVALRQITKGRDETIDAVGLVDGLYPGAAADGLRDVDGSRDVALVRIGEVYTRGTLTLARLGREAPIAMGNPAGPALRHIEEGSLAARMLYPDGRPERAEHLPPSPVIGTDSPEQYEQRDDIGKPRKRLPQKS